jgi:glycosyltransferase involved in cell wall biosynthesis
MTINSPLVSICVTAYNAVETIERTLIHANRLDWINREILVIDDASSDATYSLLCNLQGEIEFHLYRNEINLGPGGSRNRLIDLARGEFIIFLDDDDVSLPNRVAAQTELIVMHEELAKTDKILCYGSGIRYYPNGYHMQLAAVGSRGNHPIGMDIVKYLLFNEKRSNVFFGNGTPSCSLAARKSTLKSLGGFDAKLRRVEDADLAIRAGFREFHFIGTRVEVFHQFSTQGDDKSVLKNLNNELYIVDKYRAYLEELNLYSYARNWRILRSYHFSRKYISFIGLFLLTFAHYPIRTARRAFKVIPGRIVHELRAFKK